jgi:hypothetical protein
VYTLTAKKGKKNIDKTKENYNRHERKCEPQNRYQECTIVTTSELQKCYDDSNAIVTTSELQKCYDDSNANENRFIRQSQSTREIFGNEVLPRSNHT